MNLVTHLRSLDLEAKQQAWLSFESRKAAFSLILHPHPHSVV